MGLGTGSYGPFKDVSRSHRSQDREAQIQLYRLQLQHRRNRHNTADVDDTTGNQEGHGRILRHAVLDQTSGQRQGTISLFA